ncbi:hypothetical protein BCR35DRAFT_17188 [Leucosporidium creatinivorum]|uniref:Uncharacterized protein n=1 Tax=Leucosporidium creatinivorum TaxID=106004 RepID=A0A1Y2D3W9_9BASI|nr:hypothetical protein BCR35DRAFT_17188 [Leucosporidium creatinivorum]
MVHERPRPPGKRPSSSRQSLAAFVPAPALTSSDDESEATELALPPAPALRNKLSSSSLSMSQPPDSPPDTYDYPHALEDAVQEPGSPSRRTRRVEEDQISPLKSRSTNGGRESTGSISSTSSHVPSAIPFPSSSALVSSDDLRARTPSLHSKTTSLNLDNFQRVMSVADEVKGASGPPLAKEIIQEKSREELELMLQQADRLIREKTHALSELQSSGIRLVRDHQALRQRHDSLLSHTGSSASASTSSPLRHSRLSSASSMSAELRERPPPSPARQPWRSALGFTTQPASPLRVVVSLRTSTETIRNPAAYLRAPSLP